jgi:hypothetical protein
VRLSKTKGACNADLAAVFRPVTPFGVKEKVQTPQHHLAPSLKALSKLFKRSVLFLLGTQKK